MDFDVLLVILVVFLITYLPISTEVLLLGKHFPVTGFDGILTAHLLFVFSVAMIWFNYWRAVATDPGRVPEDWLPDEHSSRAVEVKLSSQGPRYCRTCHVYKPPRSHHCSHCKRCVLRMDHHCPWLNNCVGFENNHYFFRFLFYVTVASGMCMIALGTILYRWAMNPQKYWYSNSDFGSFEFGLVLFNFLLVFPVSTGVTVLFFYNLFYMLGNYTTIEKLDKQRKSYLYQDGCVWGLENAYDIGWKKNVASVLGDNPLFWLLFQKPSGTGINYSLRDERVSQAGVKIFGRSAALASSSASLPTTLCASDQGEKTAAAHTSRIRMRSAEMGSPAESDTDDVPLARLSSGMASAATQAHLHGRDHNKLD